MWNTRYILQHDETGRILTSILDSSAVEQGSLSELMQKNPRYYFVARNMTSSVADMRGNEIFEGDLLLSRVDFIKLRNNNKLSKSLATTYNKIYQVKHMSEGWLNTYILTHKQDYRYLNESMVTESELIIIGNIYDDSTLIDQNKLFYTNYIKNKPHKIDLTG